MRTGDHILEIGEKSVAGLDLQQVLNVYFTDIYMCEYAGMPCKKESLDM
jgi:hypothetical protein